MGIPGLAHAHSAIHHAHSQPFLLPAVRQKGFNFRIPDFTYCVKLIAAISKIDKHQAAEEIASDIRTAYFLLGFGILALLIWAPFTYARQRVLKQRMARLTTDAICFTLALAAAIMFSFSSYRSSIRPRIASDVMALISQTTDDVPRGIAKCVTDHVKNLSEKTKQEYLEIAQIINPRKLPLTWIAGSFALLSGICALCSVFGFACALWAKPPPELDHDDINDAGASGRDWRRPWRSAGNSGNGAGNGNGDPANTTPPPRERDESCLVDVIEHVPRRPAPRTSADSPSVEVCGICLDSKTRDLCRVIQCEHEFHAQCIVSWLLKSEQPSCPMCKIPLTLRPAR